MFFKVKDKDLSKIINLLKPQTSGASISPFSPKNLHKEKYQYTNEQIRLYKEITDVIPESDKLLIGKLNNLFFSNILCKKLRMKIDEIKVDMKKEQLKMKDYIYAKGYEKEYLEFLRKEIYNRYGEN